MIKTILVTGANGFLGSSLIKWLSSETDLRIIGLYRNRDDRLLKNPGERLIYQSGDLSDRKTLLTLFTKYSLDAVIHTAASISSSDDDAYLLDAVRDNIVNQINLISCAMNSGCMRFVFCSTISIYGFSAPRGEGFCETDIAMPSHAYGWSKYAAEEILRIKTQEKGGMQGVILRFSGIHGPGRPDGIVYNLLMSAFGGKTATVYEPHSRFAFLFLEDAIHAIYLTLSEKLTPIFSCYNVAGNDVSSVYELTQRIEGICGFPCHVEFKDRGIVRNQALDIAKIKHALGYSPRPLNDHLKHLGDFIKSSGEGSHGDG